jgi:hypothetical protein
MNKPITPERLTIDANAWTDNVRQWMADIDELSADHAAFRRRIEAAILSTREPGKRQ